MREGSAERSRASRQRGDRLAAGVATLLIAIHAGLAIHSLWIKSVAYDETSHLPAGLAAVATGEVRLNLQHPPLVKLLAGLAATTARPTLPLTSRAYERGAEWGFGREVLFGSGNDDRELLRLGRLPVVALSLVGGLAVFAWSRRRFGAGAGLFSLTLYVFEPTVLAHARWVTFDAPLAAVGTAALYLAWRARKMVADEAGPGGRRWMLRETGIGAVLGLVLATKFSGGVLLAAVAACDLVDQAAGGSRAGWRRFAATWLLRLLAVGAVLQVVYLSPAGPLRYVEGASRVYADVAAEHLYYLHGRFSRDGFPHYFLVAMAVKTALPGLAAALAGLAFALARGVAQARGTAGKPDVGDGTWRDDLYLWLPAVLWIAVTSALALPMGVRYLLPAYPLLFVLAGSLMPLARRSSRGLGPALAVLVALAQASTALAAHPDYLPYFNPLAGGIAGGPRWLDDSNLDWGQDLGRLPEWLAERGIPQVALLYFGTGDPRHEGIPGTVVPESDWEGTPRPGFYVVSAQYLVHGLWRARTEGVATDWLDRYKPADVLGGTLYLYVFSPKDGQSEASFDAAPRPPP
jgi:hypothetical protein